MAVARACATIGCRKETLVNESSRRVRAKVGDVVAIHAHHLGEPERLGEILEVLGQPDHIHFRVRWDDERESVFYPGNDATVRVHQPRREVRKS
jgi:REP element-mobilizing transposase RayT